MSKRRTTFGKLQRERDKQAKAAEKRDRRVARLEEQEQEPAPEVAGEAEQANLLAALAALHDDYEAGRVGTEEFESRRDELRDRLHVG